MALHRFLVFAGATVYPGKGWEDFQGGRDTREAAIELAQQLATDAGVDWSIAGENVGEGGRVDDSPDAIAQMAKELTTAMLNERPPNDGHRKNILSSAFHHIGIAIFRDSHGTVWLTQDFSN